MRLTRACAAAVGALVLFGACSNGDSAPETAAPAGPRPTTAAAPASSPAAGAPAAAGPSKAEFISQAAPVCVENINKLSAIAARKPSTLLQAAADVHERAAVLRDLVTRIRAVPAPAGDNRQLTAMLSAYESAAAALTEHAKALGGKTTAEIVGGWEPGDAAAGVLKRQGDAHARAFGLTSCSELSPRSPADTSADDLQAQIDIRDAFTAVKVWFVDHETYAATARQLMEIEPQLTYVEDVAALGIGGRVVYVESSPDGKTVYIGAKSAGGRCFWLRDNMPGGTRYTVSEPCASRPADTAFTAESWPAVPTQVEVVPLPA